MQGASSSSQYGGGGGFLTLCPLSFLVRVCALCPQADLDLLCLLTLGLHCTFLLVYLYLRCCVDSEHVYKRVFLQELSSLSF